MPDFVRLPGSDDSRGDTRPIDRSGPIRLYRQSDGQRDQEQAACRGPTSLERLARRPARPPITAPAVEQAETVSKAGPILVVDDDASIRELIGMALVDEGYEVQAAPHGAAALEVISHTRPSVIVLDMRMPVMDGWEFARAYRDLPGPHVPIIVLTAARDAAERAAEIRAEGFLGKPFDLNELLIIVAQFVSAET